MGFASWERISAESPWVVTGLTHHGIRALCAHSPGHSSRYINSVSPLSPGLSEDILEAGVILAPSASERRCRLPCKRPRWRLEGWSKPWEGTQALPLTQRIHQRTLCMCWEDRLSSLNPTSHQEYSDAGTDVRAGRDPWEHPVQALCHAEAQTPEGARGTVWLG